MDPNLTKVLRFFGVTYRNVTAEEFLTGRSNGSKPRLLCSAPSLLQLITRLDRRSAANLIWREHLHSVFVYGANDADALKRLARILTCDDDASIEQLKQSDGDFVVSDKMDDFCSAMAGLRIPGSKAAGSSCSAITTTKPGSTSIISAGSGALFLKAEYNKVPIFLSTSGSIIDLDAILPTGIFDIRDHVSSALPIVLYIKWAFAKSCWNAPEANACLIIDDPLLKPTHGFVDFSDLLSLMKRHQFSTNIAFIPWNWRRSTPEVARLFRENPQNYSISVHGCDHTRAEFGSANQQRLYWKAQQALERMNRHESITGIRHDRVMVFPQGKFSEAAMSALKHTDLIAAVNSDIISVDPHPRAITVSDVWDIAVMGYSNFPLFTRRYPWEGIENFAFDALLGKPAIIVIHHDYCSDHCSRLITFIERLNALKIAPTWRSLREVVRRSCRQRELSADEVEVEMYAAELRVENGSNRPRRFLIRRRESEPVAIREVSDGAAPIPWSSANGYINFELKLGPGHSTVVGLKFQRMAGNGRNGDSLPYKFKAMLRRYLCEIRDNYVTTTKLRISEFLRS